MATVPSSWPTKGGTVARSAMKGRWGFAVTTVRMSNGPIDPSAKPERLVLYPSPSIRIVGIVGSLLIVFLSFAISAAMFLQGGGAWSLLFVAMAILFLYLLSVTFSARLWANEQEVGIMSAVQHSRCRREELSSMRIGPGGGKSGPQCAFVRTDGSVAFKAHALPWGMTQIASMSRYLGLPLIDTAFTTGNVCPVCGFPRLNEPASVNGRPSHEVCPSCGLAFDDPAALNDRARGVERLGLAAGERPANRSSPWRPAGSSDRGLLV